MIKIKVSYERPEELQRLMEHLGQDVKRIKAPRQQNGKFRKAYIDLKEELRCRNGYDIIDIEQIE